MDLGLAGRTALVTGGARGIGAAIAQALAREGCDVAVVDRVVDDAARAVGHGIETAGRRALLIEADVRDFAAAESAVARTVRELGRLDVLVANAGVTADAMSWKMTEEQWDTVLDVNLKGCFAYARAAAPVFREKKSGRMVFIASVNALRGKAGQANYAASKAGIVALGMALARELGRSGVTVNVVAPGMIRTAMTAALPPDVVQRAVDESALGRIGEPEDVAAAVAYLCSGAARHVTGTVLRVDGGQLA
ncbi:MAG TPA: 3-oxoacyl-ACP reductase FabG [Gemmatimonadales bacterium]|nr:3-oxoacyl-ACP reductase FabG [Gemmatimonadales bacterium]